jgi:hypothetical protein
MFDREEGLANMASAQGAQLVLNSGAAYLITSEPQQEPGTDHWMFLIDREEGFVQSHVSISIAQTISAQMDYMRDFVAALGDGQVTGSSDSGKRIEHCGLYER